QPARPIGNAGEVTDAQALLLPRERAMVRRHDLQRTRLQTGPERILMLLVAEGRAHHAAGGIVPVGMKIFVLGERQVLDQRFAIDTDAFLARAANRLMGL